MYYENLCRIFLAVAVLEFLSMKRNRYSYSDKNFEPFHHKSLLHLFILTGNNEHIKLKCAADTNQMSVFFEGGFSQKLQVFSKAVCAPVKFH